MNRNRLLLIFACAALLGGEIWDYMQLRGVRREIRNDRWGLMEEFLDSRNNTITPDVGVIQFIRNGYSVQLEAISYTQNGLIVKGRVGNPTNLWLSNVTVNLQAFKSLDEYRDEYLRLASEGKLDSFHYAAIGTAQSSPIASLAPGTTAFFEATVPNVKQTNNDVRLAVWFSGERYSYGLH